MTGLNRKIAGIILCFTPVVIVAMMSKSESIKPSEEPRHSISEFNGSGWRTSEVKPSIENDNPKVAEAYPVFAGAFNGMKLTLDTDIRLIPADITDMPDHDRAIDCQVAQQHAGIYADLVSNIRKRSAKRSIYSFQLAKLLQKSSGKDCQTIAFKLFKSAAEKGYGRAYADLANAYRKGIGVKAGFSAAVKYFKMSAQMGYANSAYRLIEMIEKGTDQIAGNPELASQYLDEFLPLIESKVRAGDAVAARSLARLYSNSNLMQRNSDKAIDFYRYAANLGDEIAMHDLALALLEYRRAKLKQEEVFSLLVRSSELGYAAAFTAIGRLHLGQEFNFPRVEAPDWFRRGVEAGHPGAMEELATLYFNGDIVARDINLALDLASRGARLKHVGSRRLLETILHSGEFENREG